MTDTCCSIFHFCDDEEDDVISTTPEEVIHSLRNLLKKKAVALNENAEGAPRVRG